MSNEELPDEEQAKKLLNASREEVDEMIHANFQKVEEEYQRVTNLPPVPDFPEMDRNIFDDLPPLLRVACEQLQDHEEQETFLMGALGVISGMLPNVQGKYMQRRVAPNLYCFVIGKFGTGKGALVWAKDLGAAVDAYRVEQAKKSREEFTGAQAMHYQQMKQFDKGQLQQPPPAPQTPKHLKLFLPANSSKTALMQLLEENDGRGIIFETEGDTLADMLKQEYGNFNDVLRKAFHHETVSFFRRANNEDVNIDRPQLSVILSGTKDQLYRLIPSIENGLYSRFMFYILKGNSKFKNPFDDGGQDLEYYFGVLANKFLQLYQLLEAQDEPVYFKLQPHQQQQFVQTFAGLKEDLSENLSEDLEGSVNRLGLIAYRIAMVLTVVRFIDNPLHSLTCLDADFNNAVTITKHLLHYNLHIYEGFQTHSNNPQVTIPAFANKAEQVEECCRQYSQGISMKNIALNILGTETKKSTVWGWIDRVCRKDEKKAS